MTVLIDADSMVYIIAWNYREAGTDREVKDSCDRMLRELMTLTSADSYLGAFSPASENTFRYPLYKVREYKGERSDKPEWIQKWERVIKDHFTTEYGFFTDPDMEADDVVAGVSEILSQMGNRFVIASPDKDLRQMPGIHYDYGQKAITDGQPTAFVETESTAKWNFWMQMLTGDASDNIAGVPGLGPVKARKIIEHLRSDGTELIIRKTIMDCYKAYYGPYYGPIIFQESEIALRLMCSKHPLYDRFKKFLSIYAIERIKTLAKPSGFFDITS